MSVAIAFLFEDNIYHGELAQNQKLTIGSGKKNDIKTPELPPEQVTIQWKKNGIFLTSKAPYTANGVLLHEGKTRVINMEHHMGVYLGISTGMETAKLELPYRCTVRLGRSDKNDVVIKSSYISGEHMVIRSEAGIIRVEDLGSTNGTYLNGKRIRHARLRSGDVLSILTLKITLLNAALYFENVEVPVQVKPLGGESARHDVSVGEKGGGQPKFHRSPRTQEELPFEPVTLANPPSKGQKYERSGGMFASFLGTGAMFAANMAMGAASPAFMAARAASLVSPIASMGAQRGANKKRKKKQEEYEQRRRERYGRYIEEQKARISAVADSQRNILTRENPSPKECMEVVKKVNRSLWERIPGDRDFLDVRLGMGYEKLCVPVKSFVNESNFYMEDDSIREMAEEIIEQTRYVDYVPVRLPLSRYSTIGILGDRKKVISQVQNFIVSLTALHFYRDVKIVGIFDEKERETWAFLRWLPHVWDDQMQSRFLAFGKKEAKRLCERFNDILESRKRNLPEHNYGNMPGQTPQFLFLLGSREYIQQETIMKNLLMNRKEMGVSALFLFDNMYSLPNECQFIVDLGGTDACAYERDKLNQKFFFTMDQVIPMSDLDGFARNMSAVQVEGFTENQDVPGGITFLQGYGVESVQQLDVRQRWEESRPYEGLAAPIGIIAGGKTLALDISSKAHGPHGLVAGTTGSGKSELLQSWILSMAVNYHPYDVVFVLIDYKGGGMANLLEGLPHVVGKITNIGSNINRCLVSLQCEARRRMQVFEKYSQETGTHINSIDRYQRLYAEGKIREPLPHLIIVADEFAELKKEEPEFMTGLVSIARVGRSLGIHLVLATQKPGGVVDDQIWSNSRFKLCLKVQDAADSREMLKKPDAASITRAGRAYFQVGMDEIYELFQSYWSGAPYFGGRKKNKDSSNRVRVVEMDGMRQETAREEKTRFYSDVDELTAVVRYMADTAKEMGLRKLDGPWRPELPEMLTLAELKHKFSYTSQGWSGRQKWLRVPVGLYDAPQHQSQGIQYLDFHENGHHGIYGAPTTGKTTLLKTIFLSLGLNFTPDDVQIYVIDCGGWSTSIFSTMPHVGGIAMDCESEKIEKLEKLLLNELEARKKRFLGCHVSSLSAYRESVGNDLAAWILAVDNFPALFELYPEMENTLVTLARDGAAYGIYLLYTANSSNGVRYKVQQNIKGAVAFELMDKGDYTSLVGRMDGIFLEKITGRAVVKGKPPCVFQSAIYMAGETETERAKKLQELLGRMNAQWKGRRPERIPVMPETVRMEEMLEVYTNRTLIPLGIAYQDIRPCYMDMKEQYTLVVSGTIDSGKSRILERLAHMIHEKRPEDRLYIFDSPSKALERCSDISCQYGVCTDEGQIHGMLEEIVDMLNQRKRAQMKAREVSQGHFDEAEYIRDYEQICLFIDDLKEFIEAVDNQSKNSMERICKLAQHLGVLVFAAGRTADLTRYNEIESLTRVLIGNQKGMVTAGSASLYSFFRNNLKYNEKDVELQEGEAYMFDNGICRKIKPANG